MSGHIYRRQCITTGSNGLRLGEGVQGCGWGVYGTWMGVVYMMSGWGGWVGIWYLGGMGIWYPLWDGYMVPG